MSKEIKTRLLTPTEQKYTYAQSIQLEGQTGTIGHLRGDFATTGYGFYTTWFDTRPQWKSDEFKADLDTVINALREDKGLLHNRYDMSAFARHFPESAIKGNYAGILKAVEIRMDIEVGIDLECTILPDDQLVEPDDGKSTPQAVNDIIDDLIWRIEFVVWTDDLCQCVNREILFVVQNEICQKQVALIRFNIFSGQCPFGADDLHAAKEINMDVLRIVL